jgi:tetratricopeptide (TPR) repeat protein
MARDLNVDAIVEGSVQRAGNRLRINIQLIEAATDRHLWSTNYNRDFSDFLVVQDEVARAIAAEVQVRLTPEDQARLGRARAAKPETIEAYLMGMHHWWQWSDEGWRNALRYFQKAIELDPNYAPAHAGTALTYTYASGGLWPAYEAMPKAKAAAQKAIELDSLLADGYAAMGDARMLFDWDWAGAEKDFKRALELNPQSLLALDGYNNYLLARGRFDEAIAVLHTALKFDPLSPGLNSDLGWTYYASGQFDRAIPHFRKALELAPASFQAHVYLGWCYLSTHRQAC